MIRCQLRNKKIFLDVFSFDKSKQRRMLCQPDDLLHYPYNVSLRYLMQAVAAMFWYNEAVRFHVLVNF